MPSPQESHSLLPLSGGAAETVPHGRRTIESIPGRRDRRLFVVVGPCSIHDPAAGLGYAERLTHLVNLVVDTRVLAMRVYFEKPRTATGWKGVINNPYLDDSFRTAAGKQKARRFLPAVNVLEVPTATEPLDPSRRNIWAISSPGRRSEHGPRNPKLTGRGD